MKKNNQAKLDRRSTLKKLSVIAASSLGFPYINLFI